MKTRHTLTCNLSHCLHPVLCVAFGAALSLVAGAASAADCPPGWQGSYDWMESSPHQGGETSMFWEYTIEITVENSHCQARIESDGFQTMLRILADVQGDADEIRLLYRKALPDDMWSGSGFKPGDVLLRLQRQGQEIITHWGALTPQLEKNEKSGVHFTR